MAGTLSGRTAGKPWRFAQPSARAGFGRKGPWLALCALLIVPTLGWAQDMPVPVALQLSLASKILSFDRELAQRAGDEIVIGIVYQQQFRSSFSAKNAFIEAHRSGVGTEIAGRPVRCVPIVFQDTTRLIEAAAEHDLDVLYIAPLRATSIDALATVSRRNHIITLTGVPEYVRSGIAVGIGSMGDRPKILINLDGASAEGADFSSELLKLAQIVTEER